MEETLKGGSAGAADPDGKAATGGSVPAAKKTPEVIPKSTEPTHVIPRNTSPTVWREGAGWTQRRACSGFGLVASRA